MPKNLPEHWKSHGTSQFPKQSNSLGSSQFLEQFFQCVPSGCMNQLFVLIGHLYLSGMWLGVVPRTDTKRHVHLEEIGLYACSKYVNHYKPDNQHKGGGPI